MQLGLTADGFQAHREAEHIRAERIFDVARGPPLAPLGWRRPIRPTGAIGWPCRSDLIATRASAIVPARETFSPYPCGAGWHLPDGSRRVRWEGSRDHRWLHATRERGVGPDRRLCLLGTVLVRPSGQHRRHE